MTLHTLYRLSRNISFAGAILASTLLLFKADLSAQKESETQRTKGAERPYGPQIHEMRQKMITEPATSGDIKDYTEVRRFGYEAWRSLANPQAYKSLAANAWQSVTLTGSQGGHTSGRARSIAFHPTDPNTVWVATAQGGIWRTNEVYASSPKWVNLSENLPTLAMGAIAVDPKNPNILFAGTGETNGGFSNPAGQGLFRSMDGGLNWSLVLSPNDGAGTNCSQIVVDPKDSKTIYVATGSGRGLLRSKDGGDTWTKVTENAMGISPVSIALNPNETNRIVISGQTGKVFRTENGGDTWTACALPDIQNSGRIQVSLYEGDPKVIYAAVLTSGSGGGKTKVFRTGDHGATWTLQVDASAMDAGGGYPDRSSRKVNYLWNTTQGSYAHSLVVDPNTGNLFAGGLFIVFSPDQGKNLIAKSDNRFVGATDYVHADIQLLAYNTDGKIFALHDGGISYSSGSGNTWTHTANQNLSTLQFVGVDADRAFTYVIGGTQDNGTNRSNPQTDAHWKEVRGGDGGMTRVAREDPSVVFGTSLGGTNFNSFLFRSNDAGLSWVTRDDGTQSLTCHPDLKNGNMDFYPKYDISAQGSVVAIAGSSTIYVDQEGGMNCFPTKGKVGASTSMGSRPNSVHIAPYADYLMWAGTSRAIFYSEDVGETWTKVTVSNFTGVISDITTDIANPQLVYAVSSGASATPGKNFGRSADGGKTWEFPATELPSIPMWSVTKTGNKLFIGTDFGVLYSTDNGTTWTPLGQGLPMVQILSLDVRGPEDEWLLAGTFGRGAYYIDISGVGSVDGNGINRSISLGKSYPNPVLVGTREVKVDFSLENAGLAQMTLHDIQGREIMTLAKNHYSVGSHSVTIPVGDLEAGTYFYSLTSDAQTIYEKLVVTK